MRAPDRAWVRPRRTRSAWGLLAALALAHCAQASGLTHLLRGWGPPHRGPPGARAASRARAPPPHPLRDAGPDDTRFTPGTLPLDDEGQPVRHAGAEQSSAAARSRAREARAARARGCGAPISTHRAVPAGARPRGPSHLAGGRSLAVSGAAAGRGQGRRRWAHLHAAARTSPAPARPTRHAAHQSRPHPAAAAGTALARSSRSAASGALTRCTSTPAATCPSGTTRGACFRRPASRRSLCRRRTGALGRGRGEAWARRPVHEPVRAAGPGCSRADPLSTPGTLSPAAAAPPPARRCPPPAHRIQRVRALYSSETRQFVLAFGLAAANASFAAVGFATSVGPLGPFKWGLASAPDGLPARDVGGVQDGGDGPAYLVWRAAATGRFGGKPQRTARAVPGPDSPSRTQRPSSRQQSVLSERPIPDRPVFMPRRRFGTPGTSRRSASCAATSWAPPASAAGRPWSARPRCGHAGPGGAQSGRRRGGRLPWGRFVPPQRARQAHLILPQRPAPPPCPQVFRSGQRWYLLGSRHPPWCARPARFKSALRFASSPSPLSPRFNLLDPVTPYECHSPPPAAPQEARPPAAVCLGRPRPLRRQLDPPRAPHRRRRRGHAV
jgi:hypothetical protein